MEINQELLEKEVKEYNLMIQNQAELEQQRLAKLGRIQFIQEVLKSNAGEKTEEAPAAP